MELVFNGYTFYDVDVTYIDAVIKRLDVPFKGSYSDLIVAALHSDKMLKDFIVKVFEVRASDNLCRDFKKAVNQVIYENNERNTLLDKVAYSVAETLPQNPIKPLEQRYNSIVSKYITLFEQKHNLVALDYKADFNGGVFFENGYSFDVSGIVLNINECHEPEVYLSWFADESSINYKSWAMGLRLEMIKPLKNEASENTLSLGVEDANEKGLELEVGKFYECENGCIVECFKIKDDNKEYPFLCDVLFGDKNHKGNVYSYAANGVFRYADYKKGLNIIKEVLPLKLTPKQDPQTEVNEATDHTEVMLNAFVTNALESYSNGFKKYGNSMQHYEVCTFVDLIFAAVNRCKTVLKNGENKVNDTLYSECIKVYNLAVDLLLLHDKNGNFKNRDAVIEYLEDERDEKNHDYGSAWISFQPLSIADVLINKIIRIKNGADFVPEITDVANWAMYLGLKLE